MCVSDAQQTQHGFIYLLKKKKKSFLIVPLKMSMLMFKEVFSL